MQADTNHPITIAGAGLAGALLALLLAREGWAVEVFEKRPDPRQRGYEGGRSINLALAERGLNALRIAGLTDVVMAQAVMMRGRMVHPIEGGEPHLLRYGRDDSEVIWSVHRGRLNIALLDAAEAAGATIHFNQRLDAVDFEHRQARFVDDHARQARTHEFHVLIGADGAGSGVRQAMAAQVELGERLVPLGHAYKELEIPPSRSSSAAVAMDGQEQPPGENGGFRIEPNALHIWPRGGYMCIALPNTEKTFTVTLFLPNEGEPSFATLPDLAAAKAFFQRDFSDALPLMPDFDNDWVDHPTGSLATLYLDRWHLDGRAVLLGDAAHAMVPFHGQGMNCAFEDCLSLARHITTSNDWHAAFAGFEAERKPNAEAIQAMALENYLEMRDQVADPEFLLQRQLERLLAERHPGVFVPRYAMVSFLRVPYATAMERGQRQRAILVAACAGKTSLEQIDLDAADAAVRQQMTALPDFA